MKSNANRIYWSRKVNRIQDTLYVCIPKEYVNATGLNKGDTLMLTVGSDNSLIVRAKEVSK